MVAVTVVAIVVVVNIHRGSHGNGGRFCSSYSSSGLSVSGNVVLNQQCSNSS